MLPEKYLFIIVSQKKVRIFNVGGYSNNLRKNQGCPKTNSIHGI